MLGLTRHEGKDFLLFGLCRDACIHFSMAIKNAFPDCFFDRINSLLVRHAPNVGIKLLFHLFEERCSVFGALVHLQRLRICRFYCL